EPISSPSSLSELKNKGCEVTVSDLYDMKFKAIATAEDITGEVKNAEHVRYAQETKLAWEEGRLSSDITEEQRKVTEADLIIFQFPMYWLQCNANNYQSKLIISSPTGEPVNNFSPSNGLHGCHVYHTSSTSTLDPHQSLQIETTPKKTKVKTNQQGREEKREKGNRNKPTGNRKDIIESWPKDTNDEVRLQNDHCHLDIAGFTASSFWRQS
uniref:Flavodoxin-like fold domain-containing protein n=1 Tax=Acanthochromis polyacanthus TaxID=80966 RepID=A0A3Q1FRA6_9TELE